MQNKRDKEKKLKVKMAQVEVRSQSKEICEKWAQKDITTTVTLIQVKKREQAIFASCDSSDPVQPMQ